MLCVVYALFVVCCVMCKLCLLCVVSAVFVVCCVCCVCCVLSCCCVLSICCMWMLGGGGGRGVVDWWRMWESAILYVNDSLNEFTTFFVVNHKKGLSVH